MGSLEGYKQPWVSTPLIESFALSKAAGCRIFLKLENLQPSGSFKSRGIGNYMISRLSERPPNSPAHFFSSSGGNAGLACVHAARALGYPATIVVPLSTKPFMIAKLRAAGASEVVQYGASWADADRYLREEILASNPNGLYVPPFDHPDIWTGNSTLVREVWDQMRGSKPDVMICSVGGGGLFNGLMQGLDEVGWSETTTVLAVETDGANSFNKAVEAREHIALPGITSLATSLGAVKVSAKSFEYGLRKNVRSVVLSDAEAAMGCWRLADDERLVVELACGVNVALCYDGRLEKALGRKLNPESKVVLVVCGGSAVTLDMLTGWKTEFGWIEQVSDNIDIPSSITAP